MDSLVHADIFFFTTTIIFVVVGAVALVALFYAIRAFKGVSELVDRIKAEGVAILSDIGALRSFLKSTGGKLSTLLLGFLVKKAVHRRKKKIHEE